MDNKSILDEILSLLPEPTDSERKPSSEAFINLTDKFVISADFLQDIEPSVTDEIDIPKYLCSPNFSPRQESSCNEDSTTDFNLNKILDPNETEFTNTFNDGICDQIQEEHIKNSLTVEANAGMVPDCQEESLGSRITKPGTPVPDAIEEIEIADETETSLQAASYYGDHIAASHATFQQQLHPAITVTIASIQSIDPYNPFIDLSSVTLPKTFPQLYPKLQLLQIEDRSNNARTQTIPHQLSPYTNMFLPSQQVSDIEPNVPSKRHKKSHPSKGEPGYKEYRLKNTQQCRDHRARKKEREMKYGAEIRQLKNEINDLKSAQKTESDCRQNQIALMQSRLCELETGVGRSK